MKRSGEELGGYVVSRWLGSGGMGTVYEAIDADGRHVALKLLHPHLATDPVARARLRREVETLQRVRHRAVARVIDSETDSEEAFVVTELVDGVTLEHRVRERGALSREEVADLGRGLRGALTATHHAGVVHRDIKPGNVMLTSSGPVLIDFGISQIVDAERYTQIGLVTGTAGYIDPHVAAGGSPDAEADWWSWAAVLTFAATGRPPFGRGSPAIVLARASAGHPDLEGLPDDVARAFAAALRPSGRRIDPADLLAVLEGAPGGLAALAAVERYGAPEDVTEAVPVPSVEDAPSPTRVLGPTRTPLPRPGPPASPPPPPPYQQPVAAAYQQPQTAYQPPRTGHQQPAPQAAAEYRPPAADQQPAVYEPRPPFQSPGDWAPPPPAPTAAPPAPRRPGLLLVLWLVAGAFAASWPAVVLLVVLGLMLLAGTFGSGARWLRRRRLRRGRTGADVPLAWLLTPWHLLRSVLVCAAAAVAAVLVGAALWLLAWSLITGEPIGTATTDGVIEGAVTAGVVAGAVGAAWLAPSGSLVREGAREVLAVVVPTRGARALVVGVGLVAALVAAALAVLSVTTPDWAPFPSPSSFG